jgi:hypothetical protein
MMLREALLSPAALLSAGNSPGPAFSEQLVSDLRSGSAEAAETPEMQDNGFVPRQEQQQQRQHQ